MAASNVPKLYRSVIEDVINSVREAFLDEGIDEQVLIELRQTWEKKLVESKAVDPREPEHILNARHVALPQPVQIQQPQQQTQQPQQAATTASTGTPTAASAAAAASQIPSSGIAHQLTLQPGSLVQQAVLQYTAAEGVDGQKTVTVTMPQKMTITLPAHLTQGGFQTVMSGPATAATLALPPEITASLLQQAALNPGGVLNVSRAQTTTIHSTTTEQRGGMQFQTVSAEQLAKPPQYTVTVAQAPANAHPQAVTQSGGIIQLDGHCDTSDEDEDDDDFQDNDDDRDDENEDQNDDENDYTGEDEVNKEPLNSEDDVSDADPSELFETDNVVVCQYDKITRSRNKWKFHLKDGIMNLQGKDYVFQKAVGDAEW